MIPERDVGGNQGKRKREENLRVRDDDKITEDHVLVKNTITEGVRGGKGVEPDLHPGPRFLRILGRGWFSQLHS